MPRKTHRRATAGRPTKRARALQDHTSEASLFCPRCGKMSAGSEHEAWAVAMNIYHSRGGIMPERVYSCSGDGLAPFHWTRRA